MRNFAFIVWYEYSVQRAFTHYVVLPRMQSTADAFARKVASNLKANVSFKEVWFGVHVFHCLMYSCDATYGLTLYVDTEYSIQPYDIKRMYY